MRLSVITSTADILGNPADPNVISNDDSQLIYGEEFQVERERGAYVYGYSLTDNYTGYVERDQLAKQLETPLHIVCVRSTHLYSDPTFKSRPILPLSYLSRLVLTNIEENGFIKTDDDLWIFKNHTALRDAYTSNQDLAETAQIYLGTPYYYGGRASFGIDCAGLVQQVLCACGYDCPPRDSKDQEGSFGSKIERKDVQRNDVVYFKGHVGIMVDDQNIINATARHMTTLIEPLDKLEKAYGGITHIARL